MPFSPSPQHEIDHVSMLFDFRNVWSVPVLSPKHWRELRAIGLFAPTPCLEVAPICPRPRNPSEVASSPGCPPPSLQSPAPFSSPTGRPLLRSGQAFPCKCFVPRPQLNGNGAGPPLRCDVFPLRFRPAPPPLIRASHSGPVNRISCPPRPLQISRNHLRRTHPTPFRSFF